MQRWAALEISLQGKQTAFPNRNPVQRFDFFFFLSYMQFGHCQNNSKEDNKKNPLCYDLLVDTGSNLP